NAAAATITITATDNNPPGRSGIAEIWYARSDTWTTGDPIPTYQQATDVTELAAQPGTSTGTFTVPYSNPGNWNIWYYAVDRAGNVSAVQTAAFGLRLDTSAPTLTITSPADGTRVSSSGVRYAGEIAHTQGI